jgi:hypothetical protein
VPNLSLQVVLWVLALLCFLCAAFDYPIWQIGDPPRRRIQLGWLGLALYIGGILAVGK